MKKLINESDSRRDLFLSIGLLTVLIALALTRLAIDGNWQKFIRVTIAFITYSALLLFLVQKVARTTRIGVRLPFWTFVVAGFMAELASGWLRPDWRLSDALFLPFAAALLVGGFHWFALRSWRPLRARVMANQVIDKSSHQH